MYPLALMGAVGTMVKVYIFNNLKVHIESLNYILNPYVESYCVLHVYFYTYIFQNQKN